MCSFGVVLFEERRRTFGPVRNVFRIAWSPPAGGPAESPCRWPDAGEGGRMDALSAGASEGGSRG